MKMIYINICLVILVTLALVSCSSEFYTYDLTQNYATSLHYSPSNGESAEEDEDEKKGVLATSYYNGDLIGGAIWWARKGITIDKEEDFLVIAENIGPDSIPFGATFPPLDFVTAKVMVKITARAEGGEPTLVLNAIDGNGYVTNATPPTVTIKNTDDVEDYFFIMDGIYTQLTPVPHKVNGGFINSFQIFINPGGVPFTGKIFIDEIKVVPAKSVE